MSVDRVRAERAVRDFLQALGHDPDAHAELANTPKLVVEAFEKELLAGYAVDIARLIENESSPLGAGETRGLVVLRGISVTTMCPHHLLPATGTATVAYLPGARLVGLGALSRLVDALGRRLTLQEQIGEATVAALIDLAGARGAYCRLELRHACVASRGPRQPGALAVTVAGKGEPITDAALYGLGNS